MEIKIFFDLFKSYSRKFDAYCSIILYADESGVLVNCYDDEIFSWSTIAEGIEKLEAEIDKSSQ